MNTEDFVTYEQALKLKKLGFKKECLHHYFSEGYFSENMCDNIVEENIYVDNLRNSFNSISEDPYLSESYGRYVDAPTLSQAQKWLNSTKDLKLFVVPSNSNKVPYSYIVFNTTKTIYKNPPRYYSSYEEALSEGITECIKILEK